MTPMQTLLLELANEKCGAGYTVQEVGEIVIETNKEQVREVLVKRIGGSKAFKATMSFKTYSRGTLCPSQRILQDKRIESVYKAAAIAA